MASAAAGSSSGAEEKVILDEVPSKEVVLRGLRCWLEVAAANFCPFAAQLLENGREGIHHRHHTARGGDFQCHLAVSVYRCLHRDQQRLRLQPQLAATEVADSGGADLPPPPPPPPPPATATAAATAMETTTTTTTTTTAAAESDGQHAVDTADASLPAPGAGPNAVVITSVSEFGMVYHRTYTTPRAVAEAFVATLPDSPLVAAVKVQKNGLIIMTSVLRLEQNRLAGQILCPDCRFFFNGAKGLRAHRMDKHAEGYKEAKVCRSGVEVSFCCPPLTLYAWCPPPPKHSSK